jgi:hypothetical protein
MIKEIRGGGKNYFERRTEVKLGAKPAESSDGQASRE